MVDVGGSLRVHSASRMYSPNGIPEACSKKSCRANRKKIRNNQADTWKLWGTSISSISRIILGFHPTIWLFNIAMENGPFIDGLPIKNGDFPWLC
jgi:hypothetical protein